MQTAAWLNLDHEFPPGGHIFRSDRSFAVWAYTVSHSQLLLRTRTAGGRSRIDILFKPVSALNVRADYEGLAIRCARADEHERVLAATALTGQDLRVLMLETAGGLDGLRGHPRRHRRLARGRRRGPGPERARLLPARH